MKHREELYVLPVHVEDERDLYDPFDPSGEKLIDALCSYLSSRLDGRKIGDSICLELHTGSPVDINRFRRACAQQVSELKEHSRRERLRQHANALRLLVIGIVFVVIGLVFSGTMGEVTAAIVSTIGSFAIWEASAVWIEEMPLLTAKDRHLAALEEAEIRYCPEGTHETA
ncbi:MAG: hypothetical protein IJ083_12180 [Clostridia bacterium]|nr:hypothetical protein [Clostridia bacterium]